MHSLSVIIPTYNRLQFLHRTLESVQARRFTNFEVIVIDDGSVDRSLEVIRSFGKRVRWESSHNSNGCVARNRGFAISSGEYVQWFDADDLLAWGKIAAQMRVADENPMSIAYGHGNTSG